MQLARFSRSLKSLSVALALIGLVGCLNVDIQNGLTILVIVGGNNQTIAVNATAIDPLAVRTYDANAVPLGGVVVTWAIISGGGTLSTTSTTTDASGKASITYAPAAPGVVTITAKSADLTVLFSETVVAAN